MTRLRCCVPFCRRTTPRAALEAVWIDPEWICADHWKSVPRQDRAIYARAKRKARRSGSLTTPALARLWSRCKRVAIERVAGL